MNSRKLPLFAAIILALCPVCTALSACTPSVPPTTPGEGILPSTPFVAEEFLIPESGGIIDMHTADQNAYLNGEPFYTVETGKEEKSRPAGAILQWYNGKGANSVDEYRVEISEKEDFSSVSSYVVAGTKTYCRLTDLYVQRQYYWRVTAVRNGIDLAVRTSSFTTGGAPRNLEVGGVTNVRDVGGWERSDGTLVKQGMLYRTARLNRSNTSSLHTEITASGIRTMKESLHVRTELDLRGKNDTEPGGLNGKSVLGEDVNYHLVEMKANSTLENRPEEIRQVFEILSEEKNYPIFFHCDIGTDRTGIVAFLVNALMGVSEEDLYRDYMFSNFADISDNRSHSALSKHLNELYYYPGDSLSEKTASYLQEYCGVPDGQIENVIRLLSCDDTPLTKQDKLPTDGTSAAAQKTPLPDQPIELDALPGVVAWRRYDPDGITEKAGTELFFPIAEDGVPSLSASTDSFSYRNSTGERTYDVPINGSTGAYAMEREENTSSIAVNVDENTDQIILYVGSLKSVTTVRLHDGQDRTLAVISFASSGSTRKNVYRLDFSILAKGSEKLYLTLSHPTDDKRTYIAAVAMTKK